MIIKNRTFHIWFGPILFACCYFALQGIFTPKAAKAIGIALWMIYWWVSRPVNRYGFRPHRSQCTLRYHSHEDHHRPVFL